MPSKLRVPLIARKAVAVIRFRSGPFDQKWGHLRSEHVRHGKLFLTTFPKTVLPGKRRTQYECDLEHAKWESRIAVSLSLKPIGTGIQPGKHSGEILGQAKISFQKKSITIEAIQGTSGKQDVLDRFRALHKQPWANFLVRQVERHAVRCGIHEIRIVLPTSLLYYHHPVITTKNKKEIQAQMDVLYEKVATAEGYVLEKGIYKKKLP